MNLTHTLVPAAAALLATLVPCQETLAIKAGRLITITGKEIKNALILIENGKIKSIGTGTEVPWEAKVIDASESVVMPTYVIAHSNSGMSSARKTSSCTGSRTCQGSSLCG